MSRHFLRLFTGLVALATVLVPLTLLAQSPTGRIVGRILDASGDGVADAGIQVVGTTLGVNSGVEGRYTLPNVPAGTVTLQVRLLGYQPKTVTGLQLPRGGTLEQDIVLTPATVTLEATVVTAEAERGSVNAALDAQRRATGIVSAITAQQIQQSPDGDAAQVVQRVAGVTVQDGKYVFVRGLGERYTTTALNGARLPSPEPERKVVPLDLFPSSLLQTITTSKTFTPDLPGDFAGAQVDIRTREFPARRTMSYSASIGYNASATGKNMLAAPRSGTEWMGFGGPERRLPRGLGAAGDLSGISRVQMNDHIRSLRGVWSARQAAGTPNSSFSLAAGGQDAVLGHEIGYVASASYAFSQEVRADETRATAILGDDRATPYNVFSGSTGRTSVLWGGILNLSTWLGTHTKLTFDNTYSRTADNEAHGDEGFFEELGFEIQRTTLKYVERSVRSHRLRAQHVAGERHTLDWSLTSAAVTRDEPDRSDLVYGRETDVATGEPLPWAWISYKTESARRNFGELRENTLGGDAAYALKIGAPDRAVTVKIGGAHRMTERDADSRFYNILGAALSRSQREGSPEEIFDGRYAQGDDGSLLLTSSTAGGAYTADEDVTAGFGMLDVPVGQRLRVIGGARVERWTLGLDARPVIGDRFTNRFRNTDVLPSLALNLAATPSQSIRLSASRTVSRPEYRELAPITYREALGDQETFGNPRLRRALIENYDARWEWYPRSGEVLSVALFAKRFTDPIERIDVASTGKSQLSFANAAGGDSYGVEVEMRKSLDLLSSRLAALTLFANATLMQSEIRAGVDSLSALTNPERPMLGQAPYVVNAGLGWSRGRASATALFNVVGQRVAAAGVGGLPDTYEMPRTMLDLSTSIPVRGAFAVKLDAKNLLDAPHLVRQGDVIRERYITGRVVSLGVSWRD